MTTAELAALARRRLSHVPVILVAEEGPAEHCLNALALLSLIEQTQPAVWLFNPDLGRAARRTEYAVKLLQLTAHYPPTCHAAGHIRAAVEALVSAEVQWDVVPDVRAATARLLRALFLLERR